MKKTVYYVLLVLFTGIFLTSTFLLGRYFWQGRQTENLYDDLAALAEEENPPQVLPEEFPQTGDPDPSAPAAEEESVFTVMPDGQEILKKYAPLYERNPDFAGWISIPGTRINYPVMHTPEDPEYYLHRDFDREDAFCGCPFLEARCDGEKPSDNLIIYGHNMKNGSMFAGLHRYGDEAYRRTHPIIVCNSRKERRIYEIFAVFTLSVTPGEGRFDYHRFVDAESPEAFDSFVSECLERSFYDTGIRPEYGDKLLTLSTCEYTHRDGRLVVVARQMFRKS